MRFISDYKHVGTLRFPEFTGVRVMMMPVRLDDLSGSASIPGWSEALTWRNVDDEGKGASSYCRPEEGR